MNNLENIKNFYNNQFGNLTVIIDENDGNPWFIGKEVAGILGYSNTRKAIKDHIDEEDKMEKRIVWSGQRRKVILINESGLYSLMLKSKLENSKKFKRWVTSEVLPSIRKTGSYGVGAVKEVQEALEKTKEALELLKELKEKHKYNLWWEMDRFRKAVACLRKTKELLEANYELNQTQKLIKLINYKDEELEKERAKKTIYEQLTDPDEVLRRLNELQQEVNLYNDCFLKETKKRIKEVSEEFYKLGLKNPYNPKEMAKKFDKQIQEAKKQIPILNEEVNAIKRTIKFLGKSFARVFDYILCSGKVSDIRDLINLLEGNKTGLEAKNNLLLGRLNKKLEKLTEKNK